MAEKVTAEQQYQNLKTKYPDCILFFRMGDFYELFDDDAREISSAIGLTLTSRDRGETKRAMAGIPHHALNQYLGKIVNLGYKVAIAEQMSDPKTTIGVISRDVVKVITASNLYDDKNLAIEKVLYLAAVSINRNSPQKGLNTYGISYIDTSSGEFVIKELTTSIDDLQNGEKIINFLANLKPSEIICTKEFKNIIVGRVHSSFTIVQDFDFDIERGFEYLCNFFKVTNLKGYGIMEGNCAISAAYVALKYLKGIEKSDLSHITKIIYEKTAGSMDLDYSTVRNLELLESLHNNNNTKSCLIEIIDNSKTPMGKRILRNWLIKPLINLSKIEERQYFVSKLIEYIKRNNTENPLDLNLRKIVDIERIGGRIGMQTSNPRDIIALKNSLKCIKIILEDIKDLFQVDNTKIIYELEETMKVCESFIVNTELAILEEPSVDINSADIFKSEFNSEISTLRNLRTNGNEWLLNYQNQQIKLTNIPNLKVKFNNVFGYFIEISNSNKDKVPENYIRKQTLVNAERFITTELKEMEDKILNSSDRLIDLEKKLFIDFRLNLLQYVVPFQKISKIIGALDVFYSFAILGASDKYVIPKLVKSTEPILKINNLRHPIVEYKTGSKYVPNDIDLSEKTLVLLTGPNMSGKSTYIRSIAIVVIMAQMGCVVPADECVLSLVDKVFTRIGASDNLATGESTFMVEMNETANILNNATKDSLVVLDEVGRGTSTYDGLAIAFSVVKYLHEELKCRALFATHYHELTKLETKFDRIINLNVSVFEDKDNIIFMHKIIPGFAKKSFGIHVAKLAGIPNSVLMDAQNILKQLEKSQSKISNISNKSNMKIEEDLYDNFLLDNL